MEYNIINWSYIVQYADQHVSVDEFYRMQNKTNPVVSIGQRFERKS